MTKRASIANMSVEEAKEKIRRGESHSDLAALDNLTDADIRRQAAEDPEERDWDWARASLELPSPKIGIHIKLDADVVAFFKRQGAGYQTRINAALKAYVKHAEQKRA
jgi:uncharacterized protein (DUF4415 family)